jgi:hypothetical protein
MEHKRRVWWVIPALITAWFCGRFSASHPKTPSLTIATLRVQQIEFPLSEQKVLVLKPISSPTLGDGLGFFWKGQMVGMFRVFPGGGIRLWNRKGRLALWISTTPSGGRFGVLNPQEEVMGLLESEEERGHIVLYDTKGKVLFEMPPR